MARQDKTYQYQKGMDQDTAKSYRSEDTYFDAVNMRLVSTDSTSSGTLSTAQGNTKKLEFLNSGEQVAGYCQMKDSIILFTYSGQDSYIYEYTKTINTIVQTPSVTSYPLTVGDFRLIYSDSSTYHPSYDADKRLRFDLSDNLVAVCREESTNIRKIYWVDGVHQMRSLNIVYDADINPIDDFYDTDFDLLQIANFDTIDFKDYGKGSLDCGMVCYSMQYYNLYKNETTYGDVTSLISLFPSTYESVGKVTGGTMDTSSGKSISLTINITTAIRYDYFKVVALHYTDDTNVPTVRVIADEPITHYHPVIVDDGQSISDLTLEEFRFFYNQSIVTPSTIEIKDNMSFIGNVTTEEFDVDFDARAYRFDSGQLADLYETTDTLGSPSWSLDGSSTWENVAVGIASDSDVINQYNYLSNDPIGLGASTYAFIYKSDGATLGGEGINVSYTFSYGAYPIKKQQYEDTVSLALTSDRDYTVGNKKFWARGEVYRFGIRFFDTTGRQSKVKWIGDIKIPEEINSLSYVSATNPNIATQEYDVDAVAIYPVFTINSSGPGYSDISDYTYEIVYVKRDQAEKSILGTGLLVSATFSGSSYTTQDKSDGSTYNSSDKKVVGIIMPDIVYNPDFNGSLGDVIEYTGAISRYTKDLPDGTPTQSNTYYAYEKITDAGSSRERATIEDLIKADYSSTASGLVGGNRYSNSSSGNYGSRGTKVFMTLDTDFVNIPSTAVDPSSVYVDGIYITWKKDLYATQYGGPGYNSRQGNTWISASLRKEPVSTSTSIKGDVTINYFEYLAAWQQDSSDTGVFTWYFPYESTIVEPLHQHDTLRQMYINGVNWGVYSSAREEGYEESTPWYIYNYTYSTVDNSLLGISISDLPLLSNEYPTRIYNSYVKSNGEVIDNWLTYAPENYIEVDVKYGDLTRLINFKNYLYFFQPKGVGILAVNERELTDSSNVNPTALVLGTGGVLDRYDYLTTKEGTVHYNSIVQSNTFLYFFDSYNKAWIRVTNNTSPISKITGMSTWFNNTAPSPTYTSTDAISAYDYINSEILLSFSDDTGINKTIVYNEISNSFVSFYSINPDRYIQYNNEILSSDDNSDFYVHNSGEYGKWYDSYEESYVTFLSSPLSTTPVIFDNISILTELIGYDYTSSDSGSIVANNETVAGSIGGINRIIGHLYVNISGGTVTIDSDMSTGTDYSDKTIWRDVGTSLDVPFETFDSIQVWNSYQDTGEVELTTSKIKKQFRIWYLTIPRDTLYRGGLPSNPRIRDTYSFIKLSFTNNKNKQLLLHPLTLYYTSARF